MGVRGKKNFFQKVFFPHEKPKKQKTSRNKKMSEKYLLEMKNISKQFPSVKALDRVTLRVRAGTVHALMGENGAGKSTLMKCLFGIYTQTRAK